MPVIDRSGRFRATPFDWEVVRNPTTKSVGLVIHFHILAQRYFDDQTNEQWDARWSTEWKEANGLFTVSGYFNLITKNGKANTFSIQQLADCINFRFHSFAALKDGPPQGEVCELDVIPNTRPKGKDFTIENMWPIGGRKMADLEDLDAAFGAELRAAASEAEGSAPPAQGRAPGAWPFNQRQAGPGPDLQHDDTDAPPPARSAATSTVAPPPGSGAAPQGHAGPASEEPPIGDPPPERGSRGGLPF